MQFTAPSERERLSARIAHIGAETVVAARKSGYRLSEVIILMPVRLELGEAAPARELHEMAAIIIYNRCPKDSALRKSGLPSISQCKQASKQTNNIV